MKNLREVYQVIITLFLLLSLPPQVCSQNSSRLAQGQTLYERGNFPAAIELWRREIEEDAETSPTAKLALAQAYLDLGNLVAATQLLNETYPDRYIPYQEAIRANLALRQGLFDKALEIYDRLNNSANFNPINRLNIWNNYLEALLDRQTYHRHQLAETLDPYQRELLEKTIAADGEIILSLSQEVESFAERANLLNSPTAIEIGVKTFYLNPPNSPIKLKTIFTQILELPDSFDKGKLLTQLGEISPSVKIYEEALRVAIALDNAQLKSWAFGDYGGYLYRQGNLMEALAFTHQAMGYANDIQDHTKLAQWSYQAALIQEKLGNSTEAAKDYDLAVDQIEHLRERLAGQPINPLLISEIQPILQDYLEFLLAGDRPQRENLEKAISIQELSTLTELDSFFRQVCAPIANNNEKVRENTALIYSIILKEFTYIIVKTKNDIYYHKVKISEDDLAHLIFRWRMDILQDKNFDFAASSKFIYQSFFQPIENLLENDKIKDLIFIQDGIMRTVPMAAAFDESEKKYLIEKYLISYSTGFISPFTSRFTLDNLSVLFAGNSQSLTADLWGIKKEVTVLSHLNFNNSDVLLDSEFSEQTLSSKLKQHNYSILHIALHNQIGKTIADSQLYLKNNDTLSLSQFEQILRNSDYQLNLLTLAACDTALGDRYAVLGLAGLGLRTGTPNLIGSLWAVSDSSSAVGMSVLYESILKGDSIAQAVQKMQISQIRSNSAENIHPSKWAGYILLN